MCRWSMRTENVVECGADMELHLNGAWFPLIHSAVYLIRRTLPTHPGMD